MEADLLRFHPHQRKHLLHKPEGLPLVAVGLKVQVRHGGFDGYVGQAPACQLVHGHGHVVLVQRLLQQRKRGLPGGVGHLKGAWLGGGSAARAVGDVHHGFQLLDLLQHLQHLGGRASEVVQHPVHVIGLVQVVAEVGEDAVVEVDLALYGVGELALPGIVGVEGHHRQPPVVLLPRHIAARAVAHHGQPVGPLGRYLHHSAVSPSGSNSRTYMGRCALSCQNWITTPASPVLSSSSATAPLSASVAAGITSKWSLFQ